MLLKPLRMKAYCPLSIDSLPEPHAAAGVVMVTLTVADFELSARLVTTMLNVAGTGTANGATYEDDKLGFEMIP